MILSPYLELTPLVDQYKYIWLPLCSLLLACHGRTDFDHRMNAESRCGQISLFEKISHDSNHTQKLYRRGGETCTQI